MKAVIASPPLLLADEDKAGRETTAKLMKAVIASPPLLLADEAILS